MKNIFLYFLALSLIGFSACQKSDLEKIPTLDEFQLIEAIQVANKESVDSRDLPQQTIDALSKDFSSGFITQAYLATQLGYEVEIRIKEGASIGEILKIYFNLEGKILEHKEVYFEATQCFDLVYPITFIMPDGEKFKAENKEQIGTVVKEWYIQNPKIEDKPSFAYPINIIYTNGKRVEINELSGLEDAKLECIGKVVFDCPDIQANFGDQCRLNDGSLGLIDTECNCKAREGFDCPELSADFDDDCETASGAQGFINRDCECQEKQFDCPGIQANFGDECRTLAGTTGFIDNDCICKEKDFDCPDISANFGDDCRTTSGTLGFVDTDCECQEKDFDCPNIQANFGDDCNTLTGAPGVINGNCECIEKVFDCPGIQANFGDGCITSTGARGFIDSDCECKEKEFDCPNINAYIGDPCQTTNGQRGFISKDCECQERVVKPIERPKVSFTREG